MTWGSRTLPFPHNLTAGQRAAVEAVRRHGTFAAAARSLGVSAGTVNAHLDKARRRAGVVSTTALLERLADIEGAQT